MQSGVLGVSIYNILDCVPIYESAPGVLCSSEREAFDLLSIARSKILLCTGGA